MRKEYGWIQRGKRLYGERSGNRKGKRVTVISAYSNKQKKLIAPIYFTGNTDTISFNFWIEEYLLPELKSDQVIIMDNAAIHKNIKTKELIEKEGHTLLYLPPYSPDLNPIEQKWSHVKNMVKNIKDRFKTFEDCLDYVLC